MSDIGYPELEREVIHAGHQLAKERGCRIQRLFGGNTLADDVARLQVARRVRRLVKATSAEIEAAIEKCLSP